MSAAAEARAILAPAGKLRVTLYLGGPSSALKEADGTLRGVGHDLGRELARQLGERGQASYNCGGGWRWESAGDLLILRRAQPARKPVPDFTYTLEVPGELDVPEVSVRMRLDRRPVAPWMFRGSPSRAGLALPLAEGDRVTIRNRRPGDRIHPLGASGSRRLKEVLIDRRVPRQERERLPLLCVGERIAWAPGVTIDERFRLDGHATAWMAEIIAEVATT